jgi:prepilin-type N-terminal cleavage/methylation domain-containing protein
VIEPASHRDVSSESGFTLPEVLVAIALTGLILTFITGALNFGVKSWRASDRIDQTANMHVAREFLRHLIAAVEPVRLRAADNKLQLVFSGEPEELEFTTLMPERHVKAGLYRVALFLATQEPGQSPPSSHTVKLVITPFHAGGEPGSSKAHSADLLRGVGALAFSYFGEAEAGGEPGWHRRWERDDLLPSMGRIDLDTIGAERWGWPSLVVETKLGARCSVS